MDANEREYSLRHIPRSEFAFIRVYSRLFFIVR